MRFGVLDCPFPRDTECFLLPVTGDKAGEDVAGASVTDVVVQPLPFTHPTHCPVLLSIHSAAPHQEQDLSLPAVGVQKREAVGTQPVWEWLQGEEQV